MNKQKIFQMLTPVMALKSKKDDVDIFKPVSKAHTMTTNVSTNHHLTPSNKVFNDYDWDVVDEYDPIWPNEYEKLVKEKRDKETEKTRGGGGRNNSRKSSNMRFENESPPAKFSSGFGGRPNDDEESLYGNRSPPSGSQSRGGGAAIGNFTQSMIDCEALIDITKRKKLLFVLRSVDAGFRVPMLIFICCFNVTSTTSVTPRKYTNNSTISVCLKF